MTLSPKPNPSLQQHAAGEWLTKSQLAATNGGSKADIDALVKLGYLTPIRLGPRMKRFWSADAIEGIGAFRNGSAPPTAAVVARKPIDWEA